MKNRSKTLAVCLFTAAIYFGSWLILTAESVIEQNTGLMLWTGAFFVAAAGIASRCIGKKS